MVLSCPATHQECRRVMHPISPLGGARAILPGAEMQLQAQSGLTQGVSESPAWPSGVGMDVSLSCPQSVCLDPVLAGPALQEPLGTATAAVERLVHGDLRFPQAHARVPQANQRAGEEEKHMTIRLPPAQGLWSEAGRLMAFSSFLHVCVSVCMNVCVCLCLCV